MLIVAALLVFSTLTAAILYRVIARRENVAERNPDAGEDEIVRLRRIARALRLLSGPVALSILLHLILLAILLIAFQERRARELLMVQLEAGGGGGDESEMAELAVPAPPMPEISSPYFEPPPAIDTSQEQGLAADYARAPIAGGIGTQIGGGVGSSYGHAVGSGFGGFVRQLRHSGLDLVLVIDGTGSMEYIMDDVKSRMKQLVTVVHRLVPVARIGIVVFGGRTEPLSVQPLTRSSSALSGFLDRLIAQNGGEWQEDTFRAVDTAVSKMEWQSSSRRVIVLIGDTPPFAEDYAAVLLLVQKFRDEGGIFNTVDVTDFEHERWEIASCTDGACGPGYKEVYLEHRRPPPLNPLPAFYLQTRRAYQLMARVGGGSNEPLSERVQINQQVLNLAFGKKWSQEIGVFGRELSAAQEK